MKTLIGMLALLTLALPLLWLCTEQQCLAGVRQTQASAETSSDRQHLFCASELLGTGHSPKARQGYQARHYY